METRGILMVLAALTMSLASLASFSFVYGQENVENRYTDALNAVIQSVSGFKGMMTLMGAFLCLAGAGICLLGYALFKVKYLAWILTIVLMSVAIVIDVLGLSFVAGSFSPDVNHSWLCSFNCEIAYVLIIVMIVHLLANGIIIYYLTRKTTVSILGLRKHA
jgi:uncharacterized membrane protein YidH (DUF202 family)